MRGSEKMEKEKKLDDYFMKEIEKRRDPEGIYEVYAQKIYNQNIDLCKAFNCYGKFVTIPKGCD